MSKSIIDWFDKILMKTSHWWFRAQLNPATSLTGNFYYVFLGYWGKCLSIFDWKCSASTETLIFMATIGSRLVLVKKLSLGMHTMVNKCVIKEILDFELV